MTRADGQPEGEETPATQPPAGDQSTEPSSAQAAEPAPDQGGRDDASGEPRPAPASPGRAPGALGLVAVVLVILVAGAAGAGGYYLWQQIRGVDQRLGVARSELEAQLGARVADVRASLGQRADRLAAAQRELVTQQRQLREALTALRRLVGRGQEEWVLAEAEHLLLIANHRLQLQRDVETATKALELADARLRDEGDPALLPIREQIARELAQLRAVPRPDLEGMALRLQGLMERAQALTLDTAQPPAAPTSAVAGADSGETADSAASDWERAARRVWSEVRQLVVIRRREEPIKPLLSPQQLQLTRQVLQLRLEAGRTALLRQQPALYRQSLASARTWLKERFDMDDPGVASIDRSLAELADTTIRPGLPDISGSLQRLRARMQEQGRAGETEPQPEPREPEGESGQPAPEPARQPPPPEQAPSGSASAGDTDPAPRTQAGEGAAP